MGKPGRDGAPSPVNPGDFATRQEVRLGGPPTRTRWGGPGAERRLVPAKSNPKPQTSIYLMNNQVSTRTGFSRHELFFGRPGFHVEFPTPQDANPKVKEWMEKQATLASKGKELLQRIRERENTRSNRGCQPVKYQI